MLALLVAASLAIAPSDVDIKVRAEDPAIVITNQGDKPCQIAATTLGTVAYTRVEQDGKTIEPIPVNFSSSDGLQQWLIGKLQTLEPGKSAEIPLRVVTKGPTGPALEMVTWSETAGGYAAFYPIATNKPLALQLTYSVPVDSDKLCAPAVSSGEASAPAKKTSWILWTAAGVILILLALALILLRRRKAAALILIVALGITATAKPAKADYQVDPSLQSAFDECMTLFRQPGNDPAGIIPELDGDDYTVHIVPTLGDDNHTAVGTDWSFVFWDPNDTHRYFGGGGNADRCTTLYHELHHAWQGDTGVWSNEPCQTPDAAGRTLERTELLATRAQNLLRAHLGMPERTHYGDIPLPEGDCVPPEQPEQCEGSDCGDSNGDPHLLTYDNKRYDFQAVGEFVLTRFGGYQIQVRQQPVPKSREVSVNTAMAMSVGSDKVELRMTGSGSLHVMALLINGQAKPLQNHRLSAGEIKATAKRVSVSWEDGQKAFARPIGRWGLHIAVQPSAAQAGKLEGLLGDFDGDSKNDIKPKGGNVITEPTHAALYPSFADSWRITAAESLFTYEPGTSTETFTDKTFPDREVKLDSLPGRAAAEALCKQRGVTDPDVLASCILDVALTGQADFAQAAAAGQIFAGGGDFGGIPFTVKLAKAGDKTTVEFDGTAGQQVFVDIPVTTLKNDCGTFDLLRPDGKDLKSGCVINGRGFIDSTTLPVTGKYTIAVEARSGPGEARLRVITIKDQVATLTPDAPATLVHLDKPGMVGRFTFTGRKDQKIFLDVTRSTMPSQCGLLDLHGPTGGNLRSGCIVNGEGELDGTVLPEDGTYTITVDPHDRAIGDATIRLINAIDQRGTISVNGSPVIAKIQQPGAMAYFTFQGTAGQRIFLGASSSTLPGQCGVLDLKEPDGGPAVSGCITNGKGGIAERDGYVLKQTGTYTIIVDPNGNGVGLAELKLRG